MDLGDDHRVFGQDLTIGESLKRFRHQLVVVGRPEEQDVKSARASPEIPNDPRAVPFDDLSPSEQVQRIQVSSYDRARCLRSVDKDGVLRSARKRFDADAPGPAEQIEKRGAGDEVRQNVEQRASDEVAHRPDAGLLPRNQLAPAVAASDDPHVLAPLQPRSYDRNAVSAILASDKGSGGGATIQTTLPGNLEAVAFDLDSTLSYYPLTTAEALGEALVRVGVPGLVEDLEAAAACYDAAWPETERNCDSILETRKALWGLILGSQDDEFCEQLAIAYNDVREETGVHLYPGARRMLESLAAQYRLGILTNGSTEMQWPKLRALGIEPLFDAIVVAGDHGVYKPDAAVFRLLADRLGCVIHRVLFVGDNYETDVRGAHAAGMRTAWLRHPGAESTKPTCHEIELQAVSELGGGTA